MDNQIESTREMIHQAYSPKLTYFNQYAKNAAYPHATLELAHSHMALILGRNGSGKTHLLDAIRDWHTVTESPVRLFPVFSLPSSDLIEEWSQAVESLQESEWVNRMFDQAFAIPSEDFGYEVTPISDRKWELEMDLLLDFAQIPLLSKIASGLVHHDSSKSLPVLANMTDVEILRYFSFSDQSIKFWQQRHQTDDLNGFIIPFSWLKDSKISTFACDYFLKCIFGPELRSNENPTDEYGLLLPGWGNWLHQAELVELIGPAVEDFFTRVDSVEFLPENKFRLICHQSEDGSLSTLLAKLEHFISEAKAEYGQPFRDVQLAFPATMFTNYFETRKIASSILMEENPSEVNPLSVLEITPNSTTHEMVNRVKKNLYKILRVERNSEVSDKFAVEISGFAQVNQIALNVSQQLSDCDLSITAVRISPVKINDHPGTSSYWGDSLENVNPPEPIFRGMTIIGLEFDDELVESFPIPDIQIFDQNRQVWRDINEASVGQIHAICALLLLEIVREMKKASLGETIIIADELDGRLHWSASTTLFDAISLSVSNIPQTTFVASTHSVPSIGRPSLAGATCIFAERDQDKFQYTGGRDLSIDQLSALLGTNPVESIQFARLVILLEGEHDQIILEKLVLPLVPDTTQIVMVNAKGIYSWNGLVSNILRHASVQVLMLHDKRNKELEDNWKDFQSRFNNGLANESWKQSKFKKMQVDLQKRKRKNRGDDELEKILSLIQDTVFNLDRSFASRMNIFGIEANDVVDLLPIKHFFNRRQEYKGKLVHRPNSWEKAWEIFPTGKLMKEMADINSNSIRSSIQNQHGPIHPELSRLATHITRLLGQE